VSFRNTLRDTKDAVYIFLATGVGLAAGIQSVAFAAALSITYNVVILLLWWTDFGRSPANLQGPPAQRRLQRALALSNRTSAFVSMVDDQILKSLTPDQLESLAARPDADGGSSRESSAGAPPKKPVEYHRLELQVQGPADAARQVIEPLLDASAKRWEFVRALPGRAGGGGEVLQYRVRLKKSVPGDRLVQNLRAGAPAHVTGVELADGAR
jgi:hypothetical protein